MSKSDCLISEEFSPDLPIDEVPAHRFLKGTHNTTKRGWLRLHPGWGDDIKASWEEGSEICDYDSDDNDQQ